MKNYGKKLSNTFAPSMLQYVWEIDARLSNFAFQ